MTFAAGSMSFILEKTRRWDIPEWTAASFVLQIVFIFMTQVFLDLLPEREAQAPELSMTASLDFIEFQEIRSEVPAETADLSDEIIEKDTITEEKPINWENAADPAMDFDQRYSAKLLVNISPDDYPDRARRGNVGRVTVAVSLYISAAGKVRDVRIRSIRSQGDAALPYEADFKESVRRILLQKTQLMNAPYAKGGQAADFIWDTTVTFTLN